MAETSEMKLTISLMQGTAPPRQPRSRQRGPDGKRHRNSLSPSSIIVDFDEFCGNLKGEGRGGERRKEPDARRGGGRTPPKNREGGNAGRQEPGRARRNVVGRALFEMGQAKANIGKWDEAADCFDRALRIQKDFLGEYHAAVAKTLIGRGIAFAMMGSLYDSILDLEKALLIQRRDSADENESLEIAESFLRVGQIQHRRGNYVESAGSFRSALSIFRRVLGDSSPRVAQVMCIIAHSHHQRRQYDKAVEGYRNGLAAFEAAGMTKDHPDVAWVRRRIADRNIFADRVANFWDDSNAV